MQKTYTYEPKEYFLQMTLTGIITSVIFLFSITMIFVGYQRNLFAFVALIAAYNIWNTFVSRSNPSTLTLDEDGITFYSYGRSDRYLFSDITRFMAKDFRGSGKIYLRINEGGALKGRYWVHTARFNDSDELFLYLLKLEYKTHPTSIKARAWDSTRPDEDKTPTLPWVLKEKTMGLELLIAMSNKYGSDPDFVLAGGGNTSWKKDGVMYVKGSGSELATITQTGFVKVDVNKLNAMLEKKYPESNEERERQALDDMMAAKLDSTDQRRASVECILHAIFPYNFVLHLHPSMINGLSCSLDGEKQCKAVFGEDVAWTKSAKPGYLLSKTCYDAFNIFKKKKGKYPQVAILQNHGIFVAANTVDEIETILADVMKKLEAKIKEKPDFSPVETPAIVEKLIPALKSIYTEHTKSDCEVLFCTNKQVLEFVKDKDATYPVSMPYSPDHIVYCKGSPLFVNKDEDMATAYSAFVKERGYAPVVVMVQDLGFFAIGKDVKFANTVKSVFIDAMKIAVYCRSFGGPAMLDEEFAHFMMYWEFESYRLKVE